MGEWLSTSLQNLAHRFKFGFYLNVHIAQSVEQHAVNVFVGGSTPSVGATHKVVLSKWEKIPSRYEGDAGSNPVFMQVIGKRNREER